MTAYLISLSLAGLIAIANLGGDVVSAKISRKPMNVTLRCERSEPRRVGVAHILRGSPQVRFAPQDDDPGNMNSDG
jgi:hypothetical protein